MWNVQALMLWLWILNSIRSMILICRIIGCFPLLWPLVFVLNSFLFAMVNSPTCGLVQPANVFDLFPS